VEGRLPADPTEKTLMKNRAVLAALGVASILATGSARADPLDLRLGLWETTLTSSTSGMLVPDAQLQKMPPEQRERLQAAMRKRQAEGPKTLTDRTCVTQQVLGRAFEKASEGEEKDCKRTTLVATRAKQEITIACAGEHPQTREWRMQATSRESVKGNVKVVSANGSVTMDFAARWVTSACPKGD
jgi:hypothetical protein